MPALYRVKPWIVRFLNILRFSPQGNTFFLSWLVLHGVFKMALGAQLAIRDGYGFQSIVAPPRTVVLLGVDILLGLVLTFVSEHLPPRFRRGTRVTVLAAGSLTLLANFIAHTYFRCFINRGLLQFNGAGGSELADYGKEALTPALLAFAGFVLVVNLGHLVESGRRRHTRKAASALVPGLAIAIMTVALVVTGELNAGQKAGLSRSPEVELVRGFFEGGVKAARPASAHRLAQWRTPKSERPTRDLALPAVPEPRPRHNVLFVLIESLPWEQTELGGAKGQLPILSRLSEHGYTFEEFRTVFPATSRSFIAYHCGVYPTTGPTTVTRFAPDYTCQSILSRLSRAGYETGFFTASIFTYDNLHASTLMREYDVYQDFLSLRSMARRHQAHAQAVEEELVADQVLRFVDANRNKPWFATYFMFWNHAPYRLPFEDISHLSPVERYRRGLAYLNDTLEKLLADLDARGALESTIVVVAGDHGEAFGTHHPHTNHVGHIFEEDVRIPLVIHLPGTPAVHSPRPGNSLDLLPTLARLLGLPRAESWVGQDLLGADFEPRQTLLFGRASVATNGLVDGRYKYIQYVGRPGGALYDLIEDPHEQLDRARDFPERAHRYQVTIDDWLRVAEGQAWAASAARQREDSERRPSTKGR